MDLKDAIYGRRAVRDFTAEPVDDKALRQLIDAAIQAPSAVNQRRGYFQLCGAKRCSRAFRAKRKSICSEPRRRRHRIISRAY